MTTTNSPAAQPQEGELLPCPFCGGPAKFEDGGFNTIRVSCADFDCVQRQRVHKRDPKCHAKLTAHWNTRTDRDVKQNSEREQKDA